LRLLFIGTALIGVLIGVGEIVGRQLLFGILGHIALALAGLLFFCDAVKRL